MTRIRQFFWVLPLGIGLVLLFTGIPHLLNPYRFLNSILAYRILDGVVAQWFATLLPWVQVFTGLSLVIGLHRQGALGVAFSLFFIFLLAQVSALIRGLDIDCGCYGSVSHPVSWQGCTLLSILLASCFAGIRAGNGEDFRQIAESTGSGLIERKRPSRPLLGQLMGRRPGWSVIELIAVLGIMAVLLALLFPAIQSSREAARASSCRNQLRQLGMGAIQFESTRGTLPPGTLGFPVPHVIASLGQLEWYDSASPRYWKSSQHTSVFVHLLPYLELGSVDNQLPSIVKNAQQNYGDFRRSHPESPDWIGDLPGVTQACSTPIPLLQCPSDGGLITPTDGAIALVATQPSFLSSVRADVFQVEASAWQLTQPAGTNYLANAGAHSAGIGNEFRPAGYVGPFTSRQGVRLASIRDGLSNTILFGENIGAIESGQRTYFHAWMFGGLARGRGGLAWLDNWDPLNPDMLLFGDSQWSNPGGFGSRHPAGVNFVLGDGSVHVIHRLIHFQALYDLCGVADGKIVNLDGL